MARIRTIKPEFWTDETLAECSPIARLLFVAALNFADDNGNLERSARQLKAQAFPYDSIDCEPLVLEMVRTGLLVEYQVADRKYLHIKGFLTHQKIDRPSKCRIPLYEESMRARITLDEPSSIPRSVREGSLREGKGRECTDLARAPDAKPKDVPRGTEPEDEIRLHVLAIKAKYPKASREDWIAGEKAMRNIVLRGELSWFGLEAVVERYAKYCHVTNRIVANPGNWFGAPDRPWLQPWDLPKSKAENRLASNIDVMQQFVGNAS